MTTGGCSNRGRDAKSDSSLFRSSCVVAWPCRRPRTSSSSGASKYRRGRAGSTRTPRNLRA
ncbi:hypothetical protein M885DRAFT_534951 [Pelagophyceae sp. CCMP2097]|nr:hypothetical protein M885DRAFT_534951 [Pelagophyceae sp. CCMP2097]